MIEGRFLRPQLLRPPHCDDHDAANTAKLKDNYIAIMAVANDLEF